MKRFEKPVRDHVLSRAAGEFASLLQAGIPLADAADQIAAETTDKSMRRVLRAAIVRLKAGRPFSEACQQSGLPAFFQSALRVGERSGRLAEVFDRLRVYYDRKSRVRAKVRASMRYPLFLAVFAAVVLWVASARLTPALLPILTAYGAEMPAPTGIAAGGMYLLFAVAAAVVVWRLFFARARLSLPVIGKIARLNAAEQFASAVSLLTAADLPLTEALRIAADATPNRTVRNAVARIADAVESGNRLSDALRGNRIFPRMLCEMVAIGETTGRLSDALSTAANLCHREAAERTERALSMLEPALLLLVGAWIAFVSLSIFLPLYATYDVLGSLNQ